MSDYLSDEREMQTIISTTDETEEFEFVLAQRRLAPVRRYTKQGVWVCYYCGQELATGGTPFKGRAPVKDHVWPLFRGGPDEDFNLVWCCNTCNTRKNSRNPLEWLAGTDYDLPPNIQIDLLTRLFWVIHNLRMSETELDKLRDRLRKQAEQTLELLYYD
jgi:ribosomal protein L37AE/L43A